MATKPVIGVLLGDAAGVGPELVAKCAAEGFYEQYCKPIVIGDLRVLERALEVIGAKDKVKLQVISEVEEADWEKGLPVLDQKNVDPEEVPFGAKTVVSGKACLDMLKLGVELWQAGKIGGYVFGPLNKAGMHDAGLTLESEHHYLAKLLGHTDPFGEINVTNGLYTTRTTSHIPISQVSADLRENDGLRIKRAIRLSYKTLTGAGIENPRIGVAALNPHCGENGDCGREEIDVIRPAISGLMGAFGAAIYAKEHTSGSSTLLSLMDLHTLTYRTQNTTCNGCTAHCNLQILRFSNGKRFIAGNRCERGAGVSKKDQIPNLVDWKYETLRSLTDRQPEQPKATVGLPMALHYYDQLPLWHTFFTDLGFAVKLSEESTRKTYYKGQSTIPSDTVCYPAKLAHGHIESLLEQNVDFIFYPCMTYNLDEGDSDNHYNCPVVAYYPELLLANNEKLNEQNFLHPFLDLNRRCYSFNC